MTSLMVLCARICPRFAFCVRIHNDKVCFASRTDGIYTYTYGVEANGTACNEGL